MSDDLMSYRDLAPDLDTAATDHDDERADRRAARNGGHAAASQAGPSTAAPRFFVRPGASPQPANDRSELTARPIQAPRRPAAAPSKKLFPEGWPEVPARMAALRSLRLLAFNAELRPSVTLESGLVEGRPYIDARFEGLIKGLKTQDADIVVLQEIYDPERIAELRHIFRNRYPNVAFKAPGSESRLGCGNVILSNRPFADIRFEAIRGGPEPRGLVEKGVLVTRIALPHGAIRIAAFQGCAAGIAERSQRKDTTGKRDKFARQVLRCLMDESEHEPLLVVGDLSSGPDYRPELYDLLGRAGFEDTIERADDTMRVTGSSRLVPPPRPDRRPQIFSRAPSWSGVYFSAWRTYFEDEMVPAADGIRVPLAQQPALELLMDLDQH